MTPFEVFEISKIELQDNDIMCYYKNFAQYRVIAFTIGGYMSAIAYPSTPIFSNDKTVAIIVSDSGFLFSDLKTKQCKIIRTTRNEAIKQLKNMNKIDEFPDF